MRNAEEGRFSFPVGISKRPVTVVAIALGVALVACSSNSGNATGSQGSTQTTTQGSSGGNGGGGGKGTKTIAGQSVNFKKSADVSQKSSIEVEAENYFFTPTVLKGKAGETVTLELKNAGSVTHNFTLPSQHISQDLAVGQSTKVKVTFPQSGTILFYCAIHESFGMRGALQTTS